MRVAGHLGERPRIGAFGSLRAGGEQLDESQGRHSGEPPQAVGLERLDEHGGVLGLVSGRVQSRHEWLLERKPDRAEVGRVLRLRVEPDRMPAALPGAAGQVDDVFECWDPELAVERGIARPKFWQPLARPKGSQLVEREVLREPAGQRNAVDDLRRSPVRELGMGGDVCRAADLVLVPRDQDAVLRGHQIGLDEIGPLLDRQLVARERVLRPVARRAAMADDDRMRRRFDGAGHRHGLVLLVRCSSVSRSGRKVARRPVGPQDRGEYDHVDNEGAKRARHREGGREQQQPSKR